LRTYTHNKQTVKQQLRTSPGGVIAAYGYERLIFLSLLLLSAALAGCGPFYGIFIDPLIPASKVPAEHDMSDKHILIWVDDFSAAVQDSNKPPGAPALRRELTEKLRQELLDNHAVASAVDYDSIVRFRRQNPGKTELSIQQLGTAIPQKPAQEVLYIMIDNFKLHHEAGQDCYDASIDGYCKIIDVATGKQPWPAGQTHRTFHAGGKVAVGHGQAFEDEQVRLLCREAAENIAPFFYEHRKQKRDQL